MKPGGEGQLLNDSMIEPAVVRGSQSQAVIVTLKKIDSPSTKNILKALGWRQKPKDIAQGPPPQECLIWMNMEVMIAKKIKNSKIID